MIEVEGLSKKFCRGLKKSLWYGVLDMCSEIAAGKHKARLRPEEFWAVQDISFTLKRGECIGLIGANGSGKSTILKMLNGIMKPDKGKVTINGRVGALIELGSGFNPILTGRENIFINGAILGFSNREIEKKYQSIVDFSGIEEFIEMPVQSYSSGMKVRLGFAVAAHMEPDILLLDEVLAVGDMGFTIKCINTINQMSQNAAVIFVSHSMPLIARICSHITVMNKGKSVYQGDSVSDGIGFYYSMFKTEKGSTVGSGRATIHNVALSTDKRKPGDDSIFKVDYLEDLKIEVSYSLVPDIERCTMIVIFHDSELREVTQCYSRNSDFEISNNSKVIQTLLKIPKIQLNPGIYSMSVVIVESLNKRPGEVLVRQNNIKYFQVVGDVIGWASIQLHGEWS